MPDKALGPQDNPDIAILHRNFIDKICKTTLLLVDFLGANVQAITVVFFLQIGECSHFECSEIKERSKGI